MMYGGELFVVCTYSWRTGPDWVMHFAAVGWFSSVTDLGRRVVDWARFSLLIRTTRSLLVQIL